MSESTVNYSRSASYNVPADRVWDALLRFNDRNLYRWEGQKVRSTGERSCSGTILFQGSYYRLNAAPYDIRLSSPESRLGLRVKPYGSGCSVIVACAVPPDSQMEEKDLDAFLARLARAVNAVPAKTDAAAAPKAPASAEHPAARREQRPVKRPEPQALREDEEDNGRQPARERTFGSFAVLLLLFLLTAAGIFLAVTSLKNGKAASEMPVISDQVKGSADVTLKKALALDAGDSRSDVESALGKNTAGSREDSVYLSSDRTEYGTPAVAVRVVYDGNTAQSITVLDLVQASSIGRVSGAELTSGPLEDLQMQAGTGVSMVRSYLQDGITYREYHFGYLDPKYNFSSAWTGQLWAKAGSDGSFVSGTGYAYDGSDPMFRSQLPDTPHRQYDDFDEYLEDFNGYRFCLRFRSNPGRSEVLGLIPSMSLAEQIDETALYNGTSEWKKADGSSVWSYTAGFGMRGDFVMFSAVNTRLWKREGQLDASEYSSVRSGMTFVEATAAMKILPTMVYIDHTYITLGYGKLREGTSVLTEQFEFCVRFSLTDDIVESVYDNTGKQIIID